MLKNIILDIDGTLIAVLKNGDAQKPIARPYLREFLKFVFEHFDNVSIWTHAENSWFLQVYYEILIYLIPNNKHFNFIITRRENYQIQWDTPKLLSNIYKLYPFYTNQNTYILDDTPMTYRFNVHNAIPINTYYHVNKDYDNELLRIIQVIKNM